MSDFAIIVENDKSHWRDVKGKIYHFPNTYRRILTEGCAVIYYTGRMVDDRFLPQRLSAEPHYFGHIDIRPIVPSTFSV